MTYILITILAEFLYFQNYHFHISRSMEILEILKYWKYANLKIVELLNFKIMYVSSLKCMSYICMHVCMLVWMDGCMHACL